MDDQRMQRLLESPPRPRPTTAEVGRIRSTVMSGVMDTPRTRGARVALMAAAGVAAAIVLGLVLIPRGGSGAAQAATPGVLDYQVLTERHAADLSDFVSQVARVPAEPQYTDGAHRVVTQSWSLFTSVDGEVVHSAVVPERRELNWQADGSGSLNVVTEPPAFPTAENRQAWEDAGRPAETPIVVTDESFAVGKYDSMFPAVLPTSADELLALLKASHPIDDIGTAELFVAIGDLYREQTPAPAVRAALLELVDRAADVDDLGEVQDRQGRTGRGLAVTSDYSGLDTRYVLTFDTANGALLSSEEVLIGDVGKLNVSSPSVISYELFDQLLGN